MIPAIIPARGGSKGIPGKNIVPVAGKPLIVWTIEAAKAAQCVGDVIVATDCRDIADVSLSAGARVFWRSAESATDNAPSETVLTEVVSSEYRNAEAIVFLQATSPCRPWNAIDEAVQQFRSHAADSLFSARRIEGYTWIRGFTEVRPEYVTRGIRQSRTGERLEENGSIYIFRPGLLLGTGNRLGGRITAYVMSPLDSWQVDEPEDLAIIEKLLEVRNESVSSSV